MLRNLIYLDANYPIVGLTARDGSRRSVGCLRARNLPKNSTPTLLGSSATEDVGTSTEGVICIY
jgi:hypothetical protein